MVDCTCGMTPAELHLCCANMFSESYLNTTVRELGCAVKQAEVHKFHHDADLKNQFVSVPVAIETTVRIGRGNSKFIKKKIAK